MTEWCNEEGSKQRGIEATACGRHLPHARQWFGQASLSGPKEGSNHLWGARIPQREVNKDVHQLLGAQQGYPDRSLLSLHWWYAWNGCPINHSSTASTDTLVINTLPFMWITGVRLPSPILAAHFAYRRMSFGLCNAPALPQKCMMATFSDLIENIIKDFSVYRKNFEEYHEKLV